MTNRRPRRSGRSDKAVRHVRLYHWLMKTDAWQSLDCTARALYVEIASRYAGPGSNNGKIPYSVREAAAALKIGKSTAKRAFDQLTDRGFIVATERGAFSLKIRHATEWRLTEHCCDQTRELASKEFARWSRVEQKPVPRAGHFVPEAAPIGTCGGTVEPVARRYGT